MYFLDNDSGVSTMPPVGEAASSTPRWFTESPPSYPGATWFNIVQAELINAIESCGIELDKSKFDQLAEAFATKLDKSLIGNGEGQVPDMSFFASGSSWFKLPSGTIFQWGLTGALGPNQTQMVTFPIQFPSLAIGVHVSVNGGSAGTAEYFGLTRSGATIANGLSESASNPIFWTAIGR